MSSVPDLDQIRRKPGIPPRWFHWVAMLLALGSLAARAVDGTFSVTEEWSVRLEYSNWGDGYTGTRTLSGRQTGVITVTGSGYRCLDQTGLPGSVLNEYNARTLSGDGVRGYLITGDYVMPHLVAAAELYGIVYLGAFVVKVPLVDGEIPSFGRPEDYRGTGATLCNIRGSGNMIGSSLKVYVTSTVCFGLQPRRPEVVSQPKDQKVVAGADARFDAGVTGIPEPALQWQFRTRAGAAWVALVESSTYVGVSSASLAVRATALTMNGNQFRLTAVNSQGRVESAAATLTVEAPPPVWVESWEKAAARRYVVTDATYDTIHGDGASWMVVDSADTCGPGEHPNVAEVISAGSGKGLRITVTENPCVSDLSVQSATTVDLPILTNTMLSISQSGSLSAPGWNGAFPTLFPPPGDHIHLLLADQNGNQLVYLFQRAPDYRAHTTSLPAEFPDGHLGTAGYHEVLLGPDTPGGAVYVRNLYDDFRRAPGFNANGARVRVIEFAVTGVGSAVVDELKIGTGLPLPPVILTHPASVAVTSGRDATLGVTASGAAPLIYRWQGRTAASAPWLDLVESATYSGVVGGTLMIRAVPLELDGFQYRCVISNSIGRVESDAADLSVAPPPMAPVFDLQPSDLRVTAGDPAGFVVGARGVPEPDLSWELWAADGSGWVDLRSLAAYLGATSERLSLPATVLSMSGDRFRCLARNAHGSSTSLVAVLTVDPPPEKPRVERQPAGLTLASGNSALLSVEAAGTPPLAYQWLVGARTLAGATSAVLELRDVIPSVAGQYRVIVSNRAGGTTSEVATVEVGPSYRFVTWVGDSFTGASDGAGSAAKLQRPGGIAVDWEGTIYVADEGNHVLRRIDAAGTVETIAGDAREEATRDGRGSEARFRSPRGIAVAPGGDLYVTQWRDGAIRRVDREGVVTTILPRPPGADVGSGTVSLIPIPIGIAVAPDGDLIVSSYAHAVYRVKPSGVATLFAGSPGNRGHADGEGVDARFDRPSGVAVDASGQVYVADEANHLIRRIDPTGRVSTLAGVWRDGDGDGASDGGFADGGPDAARYRFPLSVALANEGGVYVADTVNAVIRRIGIDGVTATVAGVPGAPGDADGAATAARFSAPVGLAVEPSGGVVVVERENSRVRRLGTNGVVTTVAGGWRSRGSADGPMETARFNLPIGLSVDADLRLFVADSFNHVVRWVAPDGDVTTVAGKAGVAGSADGPGPTARFSIPGGVAVGKAGDLWVADTGNSTLRRVDRNGVVSTVAGAPGESGVEDGLGAAARFSGPEGVAVAADGTVFLADTRNHAIRSVANGGVVTTVAGVKGNPGAEDGPGATARFRSPRGLAIDRSGRLLVADFENHIIRRINAAGGVSTLAGAAGKPASDATTWDGAARDARFRYPRALAVDASGVIYVADNNGSMVRRIVLDGSVSTLAGMMLRAGHLDGVGAGARFVAPSGIAVDRMGLLYVSDNNTIRKGWLADPVGPLPLKLSIERSGESLQIGVRHEGGTLPTRHRQLRLESRPRVESGFVPWSTLTSRYQVTNGTAYFSVPGSRIIPLLIMQAVQDQ